MAEGKREGSASCVRTVESCACGRRVRPLVSGPLMIQGDDGNDVLIDTVLYYCDACDLAIRGVDWRHPYVARRYELTDYTDPRREAFWREKRYRFFNWLFRLAKKHLGGEPKVVLDFGCSFGHLLDVFAEGGAGTIGIEASERMLEKLQREGRHRVYRAIEEADIADGSVDLITVIDSLYCYGEDPTGLLKSFTEKLRPGGVLITRTTDRNHLYRLYASCWHLLRGRRAEPAPVPRKVIGDLMFGFSERALVSRFEHAGLERIAAYRWEHKRKGVAGHIRDVAVVVLYHGSLGKVDFCPGLVLVGRK